LKSQLGLGPEKKGKERKMGLGQKRKKEKKEEEKNWA
jgi:hypothetical protein